MDEQEKKLDELEQQEKDGGLREEAYFTVKSLVGVLAVLVLVFTFIGRLIVVDGASMEPTLLDREMLVVRSIAYTPRQGDIVVLAKDGFHNGDAIVKRVIATGEQHVEIDYGMGEVRVDGVPLDEPYIKEPTWTAEGIQSWGITATTRTTAATRRWAPWMPAWCWARPCLSYSRSTRSPCSEQKITEPLSADSGSVSFI